jgi:hypothetical protein
MPEHLGDVDLAMVRFAGTYWSDPAAREQAIRDRFGMSPVRFHQRIARLIDTPAALAAEPVTVHRLQRIRDARRRRLARTAAGS